MSRLPKPRRLTGEGHGERPVLGVVTSRPTDRTEGLPIVEVIGGEATRESIQSEAASYLFAGEMRDSTVRAELVRRNATWLCGVENAAALDEGDVLLIDPTNGSAVVLHDAGRREALIVATNRCNSNCVMCPDAEAVRRRKDSLSPEHLCMMPRLLPADIRHVTVTGGEPSLAPKVLLELLGECREWLGAASHLLLTNARMCYYPDFAAELAARCPSRTLVSVPVHAATPDLHDAITRAPGSFRQTTGGIENLLALGVPTEARVVVTRRNLDLLEPLADFLTSFVGLRRVVFMSMELTGNAALNRAELWVDLECASTAVVRASHKVLGGGVPVTLYNFPLCCLPRDFWPLAAKSISAHKVAFAMECDLCALKADCGGFFGSTLRLANPPVSPISVA